MSVLIDGTGENTSKGNKGYLDNLKTHFIFCPFVHVKDPQHSFKYNRGFRDVNVVSENGDNKY